MRTERCTRASRRTAGTTSSGQSIRQKKNPLELHRVCFVESSMQLTSTTTMVTTYDIKTSGLDDETTGEFPTK
eukprot:383153-Amphidinium_carterae.1